MLLIIVTRAVTERRLHPPEEPSVHLHRQRGIRLHPFSGKSPRANSPAKEPQTAVDSKSRPTGHRAGRRHLHRQRDSLLASSVLATREDVKVCVHFEGQTIPVQARGAADRAKAHETIALLRLKCHLQLVGEKSWRRRCSCITMGAPMYLPSGKVLHEVDHINAHVSPPHRGAGLSHM